MCWLSQLGGSGKGPAIKGCLSSRPDEEENQGRFQGGEASGGNVEAPGWKLLFRQRLGDRKWGRIKAKTLYFHKGTDRGRAAGMW